MRIGLFGGSFDPVHTEHVRFARAAIASLGLSKLIVLPSYTAPHKLGGARVDGNDRLEMLHLAFHGVPEAEISMFELEKGDVSYSFETCVHFKAQFPKDELFFLVGADMLQDFPTWRNPQKILESVTLAAGGRGNGNIHAYAQTIAERFQKQVEFIPFCGEPVSSTRIRTQLFFGKQPEDLDGEVYAYIQKRGLYTHPAVLPALALEKEERQEHSFRVALLAARYCRREKIAESKALLASALHDCGKYVPLSSPLLAGFRAPDDVPPPVMHQYTGAYLAEHVFHVDDEEVLDAIRFHTSGRENMTQLDKLIFVSDMLEESRTFPGVDTLREALAKSLNEAYFQCICFQERYLKASGKPVYPLSHKAYEWEINHKKC